MWGRYSGSTETFIDKDLEALEAGEPAWRGLDIQVLPGISAMLAAEKRQDSSADAVLKLTEQVLKSGESPQK